ncbi:MAG: hypothetical protein R3A80_13530 [Bdellovibrionota bacterium]
MKIKPLAPIFLFLLLVFMSPAAHSDASDLRQAILNANFYSSDLWVLGNQIEEWGELQEFDPAVQKKLLKIIGWTRSGFFPNQNIHMRQLKRAATNVLVLYPPEINADIRAIAKALNASSSDNFFSNDLKITDYCFTAELLVAWAKAGNATALEELTLALESRDKIKVLEVEFALAKLHNQDPEFIKNIDSKYLRRIHNALGRPWVYSTLQVTYRSDMRFSEHANERLAYALQSPTAPNSSAEDIKVKLDWELEHSPFYFLQTIEFAQRDPALLRIRDDLAPILANAIQRAIELNPRLRYDPYFASIITPTLETYALHSPFIDNLLADWLSIDFKIRTNIIGLDQGREKAIIFDLRNNAINLLIRIQERFHYAETVARAAGFTDAEKRAIGYIYFPVVQENSTMLDPNALKKVLDCKYTTTSKKLDLLDFHFMEDPLVQSAVIRIARDAQVQSRALDLLNTAPHLEPKQISELGALMGITSPSEAATYFPYHTNLRGYFSNPTNHMSGVKSCLTKLRTRLFGPRSK